MNNVALPDSFIEDTPTDTSTMALPDSFIPDVPTSGSNPIFSALVSGFKDVPAQITDLLSIPVRMMAAVMGKEVGGFTSKLANETVPYLTEKALSPITSFDVPVVSAQNLKDLFTQGRLTDFTEVSPTPADIVFFGIAGAHIAKNQVALAKWNYTLDKLIRGEEVRGAVMNNMPAFERAFSQVGLNMEGMDLTAKTNFVLSQAQTSPKVGTIVMGLVNKTIAPIPEIPMPIETTGRVAGGAAIKPTQAISEVVKPPVTPEVPVLAPILPQGRAIAPEVNSIPTEPIKPIVNVEPTPIGETKTSGYANRLEVEAVKNGIIQDMSDKAEYTAINHEDQARRSIDLVNQDYGLAKNIAFGNAQAPNGLKNISVYNAVKERAKNEGDVRTILDLGMSKVSSELSEAAQTMGLAERRDPEDPITAISEIYKAREKMATKRLQTKEVKKIHKDTVSEIKNEIKKVALNKQGWSDFVKSIQC